MNPAQAEPVIVLTIPTMIILLGIHAALITALGTLAFNVRQLSVKQSEFAAGQTQIRLALGLELKNGNPPRAIFLKLDDADRLLAESREDRKDLRTIAGRHDLILTEHSAQLRELGRKG